MYHIVCPAKYRRAVFDKTADEVLKRCQKVKEELWGGEFWSDGYFVSIVGKHGDEKMIGKYVKNQGSKDYQVLHQQLDFLAKVGS